MNKTILYVMIAVVAIFLIACAKEVVEQVVIAPDSEPIIIDQDVQQPEIDENGKEIITDEELKEIAEDETMILPEEAPEELCEYKWGCINETHRARQWEDCHWDYKTYCKWGCVNGNCKSALS